MVLRVVDFFAGTGAFSLAFVNTEKAKIVFANDMVSESEVIYNENFEHKLTKKDMLDLDVGDIPSHDVFTGGFSCQPFSQAGLKKGFDDPRSNVFWKIIEILEHHQPKCVVLENVKNLITHDGGNTFATIKSKLDGAGYKVKYKVLNTSKITGVPQHRERIYIVGFLNDNDYNQFTFDDIQEVQKTPIKDHLVDEVTVPDKYYYTSERFPKTWSVIEPSLDTMRDDTTYQFRRVYVRENKSNECPTLTANMGTGGHNVPLIKGERGLRKLTPRECFNFQGFPSTYSLPSALCDSKLYKLASNAVSYPVVHILTEKISDILTRS
tara:strand:- start:3601 stop:4569 length:969 start_codon:yes stop_codon:yes gene_type:complete